MEFDKLETQMRRLEAFHHLQALPGSWIVLRIDGRSFSQMTSGQGFDKPFDIRFHQAMVAATERLMRGLTGLYGYTESDEISILMHRDNQIFDREVEKLVSISAGIASSCLTLQFQKEVHCDSRVWLGAKDSQVLDYFSWRQTDASRCCLNGWCYWTLRQHGASAKDATAQLRGKSFSWKNELLFSYGINFNDIPLWQKRGTGLFWTWVEKQGRNPITGQDTTTKRRQLMVDRELPMSEEYIDFLKELLDGNGPSRRY